MANHQTMREPRVPANGLLIFVLGIVALAVVVIWQGVETRHHLEVSMRPHLDIFLTPEFDDQFGLTFDNAGAGPALIRGYTIAIDGQSYTEEDVRNGQWDRDQPLGNLPVFNAWLQPGDSIVVGRHRIILAIPLDSSEALYERFLALLKDVHITIDYESFHGESFVVDWSMKG